MNGLAELVRSLGPARIAAMGAVALGLVGFFAYIMMQYSAVTEAPLYTGLSLEDSAAIVSELESAGIPYTLRQDGSAIFVTDTEVTRLRMRFAEEGLPAGGGVGYEIFDKTDALGTTSFVQNVNALRALEGELARTIRAINRVEQARVHLVLPERQLFRQETQKPTASIVLKTRGVLEPTQIRAIQHLVASAVNGLDPSRISIVDEAGRLLAEGTGDDASATFLASSADERTSVFQRQVEDRVRDIVESVVGAGRARVKVAAELDFNRVSETRDLFDPNGQVVRSTQTREESSSSRDGGNDQVTAANQVPNAGAADEAGGPSTEDQSAISEETINYEISKTTRTQVTEMGGVKRLSVAVVVDGRWQTDDTGTQTYVPRAAEELQQIQALVRTAMGFDQNRGDQVEVVNLQFADGPPKAELDAVEAGLFDFSRNDLMRFAEMGVMLVLTILVLLFAVRPLIKRILSPEVVTETREITTTITGPDGQPITMILNANGELVQAEGTPASGTPLLEGPAAQPGRIEEAKAQGAAQMDQIRRVGDLVVENPNEAAIIIRTWLSEAA
ncbi:flagellar basal-body MS-ring/collar protein FliF [Mongoliimonas terrestris]|uniref:flagellar basal-body MS-ring/collar protein FliF n=1 Tax=Mongoliimonas terrestris TaxID=1709001 RepID=UPI00094954B0|nr:flagellar basal-body MS-ring/collar protein FliF [Mongoliimonas terrestris]